MNTTHTTHSFPRRVSAVGATVLAAAMLFGAHAASATGVSDTVKADAHAVAAGAKKAVHTTEAAVSDSWITAKVKSEILANSVSKGFKVGVKTTHGAVSLSGKLPNEDAIDLVKVIAKNVKGVKSVNAEALVIGN